MLIAAAVHDVGHPGVTGKYLIAVGDELALQYNDSSPL
jgi:cAMP-specific phosphodiesterase 4